MVYSIAVLDDCQAEADFIAGEVAAWAASTGHAVRTEIFRSAEDYLFGRAESSDDDILLLDIEMGGMSGVELAKRIRRENETTQLVFITGYPGFIAEGYEVAALHYLLKPVAAEKLAAVLNRAVKNIARRPRSVLLKTGSTAVRLWVEDIFYVEAFQHTCAVNAADGSHVFRCPISEIEALLGEGFLRCHRSYLVGLRHVRRIEKSAVLLDNGAAIPLARGKYAACNQAFIHYYRGE